MFIVSKFIKNRFHTYMSFLSLVTHFTPQERAKCVEWFIEEGKSSKLFQRRYRREHGLNSIAPSGSRIREWYAKFQEGEAL